MGKAGQPLKNKVLTPRQAKAFKAVMGCHYREMPKHPPTGLVTYHKEHRDKLYAALVKSGTTEPQFLKNLGLGHSLIRVWHKKTGEYPVINRYTLLANEERIRQNARLKELTGVERTQEHFTKEERLAILQAFEHLNMGQNEFSDQVGLARDTLILWRQRYQSQLQALPEPSPETLPELTPETPPEHATGLPTVPSQKPRRSPRTAHNGTKTPRKGEDTGVLFLGPEKLPSGVKRFAVASVQEAIDMLGLMASGGIEGNVVIMIDPQ